MRSIRIESYGGPEVVQYEDVPVPVPGPGEVLVRVAYAGINFMDVHTRQGKYQASRTYPVRLPCTLGMEGAGAVEALGPGVDDVRVGERVAWCLAWGSYADFAVVPAARLAQVPPEIDLATAASILFHGCTAHYLIEDIGGLGPGSSCLVHAASGGIGQLLVQLARRKGATVFATTSSADKAAVARERGAHAVFAYGGGRFADEVRAATGGVGVDVVYDAIGSDTLRDSLRAARMRGLIVNYGAVSGAVRDLDPLELGEAGSLFLTRPRLADHLPDRATLQRRADDVFAALRDGELVFLPGPRHAFADVARAHAGLEERRALGKALLVVQGEP